MMKGLHEFALNEQGTTSVEYGAIASFISIVVIGALIAVGSGVANLFGTVPSF
ncbi:MAG: Flp family type IVb pilin [Pseudomonadota bacterium]|nr:Flp family type IVb pilin [Pseudomonadota bacterium]